jgi:hypothetical protein
VLVGGNVLASRQEAADEPTFVEDEVVRLYSSPGADAPGALDWDPATVDVEPAEEDPSDLVVRPTTCRPVVSFVDSVAGASQVTVELRKTGDRRAAGEVGNVVTQLFAGPAEARANYQAVLDALPRCLRFRVDDSRLRLSDVTLGEARRHRSDATFRLVIDGTPDFVVRTRVVRFGNTLTWSLTDDSPPLGGGSSDELPNRVVTGLQRAYRART